MTLTWPNLLSALRIGLIPLFIISVIDGQAIRALVIFALAGITDLLDGFIARFLHQQSPLGAYLDPMADKLLLVSAYVMLAIPGLFPGLNIPIWVTVLVITRDVIIVGVALIVHLTYGISKFPPSWISKWNTAFQIIAVFAVLLTGVVSRLEMLAFMILMTVVVLTIASGLEYGYRFIYRVDLLAAQAETATPEVEADAAGDESGGRRTGS